MGVFTPAYAMATSMLVICCAGVRLLLRRPNESCGHRTWLAKGHQHTSVVE